MNITLYWRYLKYDIDQETWKAAKCHITDDALAEVLNEAQTGIDSFDHDFCQRKIEQALMGLQDSLHRFFLSYKRSSEPDPITEAVTETTVETVANRDEDGLGSKNDAGADDTLQRDQSWTIELQFDGRRNVNAKLLASELHKYVVLYVLQEWAKMALPVMEQNYVQRMILEEQRIKRIAYRKEPPVLALSEN